MALPVSATKRPILCESSSSPAPKGEEDPFQSGPVRYVPYIARIKLLLLRSKMVIMQGSRYVAYSSDVGESLRPVLKPWMVNLTYGVAGAYIVGDTAYSGYRKHRDGHGTDVVAATCIHTATFQGLASLALPAAIIHTAVHQTQHFLEKPQFAKNTALVKYGPSAIGLAIIPFLPYTDPPIEYVIDAVFDKVLPAWRVGEDPHHH
jgi:fission process protein 1